MSIADDRTTVNVPSELSTVVAHLARRFGAPELALDGPPTRLGGGFWAEMWTLGLDAGTRGPLPARVVLRLAPDAEMAAWETTFQAGVAAQGYPTPNVLAFDTTPPSTSRAWCVMDHADGAPLLGGLDGLGALRALPRLARTLPDTLAAAAADLHRLDPEPIVAALGHASDRRVGIDGALDHYASRSQEVGDTSLRRCVDRLAVTRPESAMAVICHGDLHPFNVLVDTDTGRHVVLDWTAAQVSHPAYDLAFTHLLIANPPLVAPRPVRPVLDAAARRIADRFVRSYCKLSPHRIDSDTLDWYRRLQACRIMTELAGWHVEGTIENHRGHPWLTMEPMLRPLLTA